MDAMIENVPVAKSLYDLYPEDALPAQVGRWNELELKFKQHFDKPKQFVARSPGRVNIIGEHVDYSMYDVLPMGIAADVIIAVAASPSEASSTTISIANVNPDKFKPGTFSIEADNSVSIDASAHEWTNYYKAGLRGALSHLAASNPGFKPVSMQVMVDGTVPAGGGLSSSAAFVCASALSALYANGMHSVTKKTLVELAIVSERAVGVNSGGMDQAASVCSIRGDALHVSFTPHLLAHAIAFPKLQPPITFMIAQSFVAADKHVTAPECYNLRVVEVTLAAACIAAALKLDLPHDASPLGTSLRGLHDAYFSSPHAPKDIPADDEPARVKHLLQLLETHLPSAEGYTREEIIQRLGLPDIATLEERYMSTFPVRAERFKLARRAKHVWTEVLRVHSFMNLLQSNNKTDSNSKSDTNTAAAAGEALLRELGALMNATQDSCRDDFQCSCPELDRLCELARGAGAYGSRLTGAGWGGCCVHLVPQGKVDDVRRAWVEGYYREKVPEMKLDTDAEALAKAVVVSEPGDGAVVIDEAASS